MEDDQSSPNEQMTWPMARHGAVQVPGTNKLSPIGSRVLSANRVDAALRNARDYMEQTSGSNELQTQHTRALIQNLYDELNSAAARAQKGKTGASRSRLSSLALGVIREGEPTVGNNSRLSTRRPTHFESMIFTDVGSRFGNAISRPNSTRGISQMGDLEDGIMDEAESCGPEVLDIRRIYDDLDPFYIRAIPHIAMISWTMGYILSGAYVLQKLDAQLANQSYHNVVMFAWSLTATVGWGGSHAETSWCRLFVVVYTLLGVPMVYSTMANLGRLISEFYTVDWLYVTAVVRGERPKLPLDEIPDRMSIKMCLNLMFVYAVIGLVLFSGLLEKYDVVQTIYFLAISTETIGLGDVEHMTINLGDSLLTIVYLTFGIIIVSAFFLNISYYFQVFFYVHLTEYLHKLYEWSTNVRKQKVADTFINNKPS
ncbi:hypothetical protein M3Y95_00271500 [Aphelenchoides besseyi]|nr:hypothetical protein M3Y95_00271500 [Aphelenchoides besseyi]